MSGTRSIIRFKTKNYENDDENIENLLYSYKIEDVGELYKSQLENSPPQPENIENLLYESDNKIEDVSKPYKSQLENFPSQSENTSTQPIPTSIDINDLVDEYANVSEKKNRQNKRDDNYIKKKLTDQNQQSQQIEKNRQNIRVNNYIKEELTDQNQQSQQVEKERQVIDRSRRIKIPSYKARQNMIPINEVPEPTNVNIISFTTTNIIQIAKITQSALDKFVFT